MRYKDFVPPRVPLLYHPVEKIPLYKKQKKEAKKKKNILPLKRIYPPYYLTIIFPPRLLLNSKNGYLIMLRAF